MCDPAQADSVTECGSTWPKMAFVSHPRLVTTAQGSKRAPTVAVPEAPIRAAAPRRRVRPIGHPPPPPHNGVCQTGRCGHARGATPLFAAVVASPPPL